MSERFRTIAGLELRTAARRPLFWIWLAILALLAWGLSGGDVQISSGDSTVGGTEAWITSHLANSMLLAITVPLFYAFFVAVAAGTSLLRDEELRVGPLLHATPLRAREYVWGKFLSLLAAFLGVLGAHVVLAATFNHLLAGAEEADVVGPFHPLAYLWPALVFGVPTIVFVAGASFWAGERTRRPIVVFLLPIALLLLCLFFLWFWSPAWLDPRLDRALMLADPTGFRWLNRTYLEVDRGVDFYNTAPLALDVPFALSRLAFVAAGLLGVASARRHLERTLRGRPGMPRKRLLPRLRGRRVRRQPRPLADLGMRSRPRGALVATLQVTRAELRELWRQPGLYLFLPIIVLQTLGNATVTALGPFDTPLLLTPGIAAERALGWLTVCTCLLLLFYLVESLRRERDLGLAAIDGATPVSTRARLAGKLLANGTVALAVVGVTVGALVTVIVYRGRVPLDLEPFALLQGALLLPTLVLWSTFVAFLYALTGSRHATYALGLGALLGTLFHHVEGEPSWVTNWTLAGALEWSDMSTFELDRRALVLNRAGALGAALLLFVLAARILPRRAWDTARALNRLGPRSLAGHARALAPWAAVPAACALVLHLEVEAGFQGGAAERSAENYHDRNVATWTDAPDPDLARVDLDLTVEPEERRFRVAGTYELENRRAEPLSRFALTEGFHWEDGSWSLDGSPYEPEDRSGLRVFVPDVPLAPGARVTVGFEHGGRLPDGITRNGGGANEFVLPSGVVLTSFTPSFAPVVGFVEGIGVEEEDRPDEKDWPEDFFEGETRSFVGGGPPYPVRTRITAPEEYTMNGVGTLVSDEAADGLRTVVWETEEPVAFFNVVGGRWAVERGERAAVFHHPSHPYNVAEILRALEGSLEHYSEWFHPYPWDELKLSEFPALASYAQGFATNIPFSEELGFLTETDELADAAFLVTAHEAAHQWWANLLTPGEGPGGNVLSEGAAHFSTILLREEMAGEAARIALCEQLEERYAEGRRADAERPLVRTDGSRPGDTTVTYDKGGWVLWMLLRHMGRENALDGIRSFVEHYRADPDFPVLQDFVAHLRPFAPDPEAYDAFCDQWFFQVVLPRYRVEEATLVPRGDGAGFEARAVVRNDGTGRMPVEVAAARGERFSDQHAREGPPPDAAPARPAPDPTAVLAAERGGEPVAKGRRYREARVTLLLGPGEEAEVVLPCDFEPERLVVDPDARVLQLHRKLAVHRF